MGSSPIRVVSLLANGTLNADMAQLAEQLICNQQVFGSSPNIGLADSPIIGEFAIGGIPEWPKGADCKSVSCAFGGSNPPSPTRRGMEQSGSSSGS